MDDVKETMKSFVLSQKDAYVLNSVFDTVYYRLLN